ncbi:MAG: hypothetical protein JAZ13_07275 [Candidatus Thiodiazotropha taylori]|nr:hypothetical protein [Candidatus Thiodiazotropha taylori]
MNKYFGMHGWKEFYQNRKSILAEYHRLRELTTNRPVKTAHGIAVEAYIRKWLSEFLPKKWAVTSGYVIPTLYRDKVTLYHYDIIIYDHLNAPVLWTEGNEDDSSQGRFRAIPAKNVAGILEVKSRLNKKNVGDMIEKLSEINNFKEQLPLSFISSGIFIELRESDNTKLSILESIQGFSKVHNFIKGIVLCYENDEMASGLILAEKIDDDKPSSRVSVLAKPIDDLAIYQNEEGNIELSEEGAGINAIGTDRNSWAMSKTYNSFIILDQIVAGIQWSRGGFSEFCIDLISYLDGMDRNDKDRPSFGRIFDTFERKPTEAQPEEKQDGLPYLEVAIGTLEDGGHVKLIELDDGLEIIFCIQVTNTGDAGAILSDDYFTNKITLDPGSTATNEKRIKATTKPNSQKTEELRTLIVNKGFNAPYRVVYYPSEGEKVFKVVERTICIKESSAVFV